MTWNHFRFSPLDGGAGDPITLETACQLKSLVLGSPNQLIPSGWVHQSFGFSDQVSLGLLQHKGGPCGVLAAVQAHLVKENMPQGLLGQALFLNASGPTLRQCHETSRKFKGIRQIF